MQDFKKLRVWREAIRLSLNVLHSMDRKRYASYPGKRTQTFKSAESIASNISEGAVKSNPEFGPYLDNALASAAELENHLICAGRAQLIRIDGSIDCSNASSTCVGC
jgi:four helix bundle protein